MSAIRSGYVIAALAVSCSAAEAQPDAIKVTTVPVLSTLLAYSGDEDLQKELRLSEEQSKRLLAYRQKLWDETYRTAQRDLKLEEQYKAIDAEIKAILGAEQVRRATELAVSLSWNAGRFGGFGLGGFDGGPVQIDFRTVSPIVLAQYPEIAGALKLDETQKKLVENVSPGRGGFGGAGLYLTNEQVSAVKALAGEAPKMTFRAQSDPRLNTGFGGGGLGGRLSGMPQLNYLLAADVQKELKLTDDQIKALTEMQGKDTPLRDLTMSPAEERKARDSLVATSRAAIEKLLSHDQVKRLEQISRQQRFESEFDEADELSKVLEVTADQRKTHANAIKKHAEAVAKAVGSGEAVEKVRAAVESENKALAAAREKILTDSQRTKKNDWLGPKFVGNTRPLGGRGGASTLVNLRRSSFGRFFGELSILSQFPGLQAELKLSEDQLKRVRDAVTELNGKFPPNDLLINSQDTASSEKFVAAYSHFVEKSIADILTNEQRARLRELMIQQLEAPQTGRPNLGLGIFGWATSAVAVPGVAEAINLTVDQKKKLLDGAAAVEVLRDDQKSAINGMIGKPVTIDEVFALPARGRSVLQAPIALAQTPSYWQAINVTPEQADRLVRAFNEYSLALISTPRQSDQMTAAAESVAKAVEGILTAEQRSRLAQISLQLTAGRSLVTALLGTSRVPSAANKQLAITEDQAKAIQAVAAEFSQLARLLNEIQVSDEQSSEVSDMRLKLRDRHDAKIVGLLSADQQKKWNALTGEPHPGITKSPLRSPTR